jgi:hypothetical protein
MLFLGALQESSLLLNVKRAGYSVAPMPIIILLIITLHMEMSYIYIYILLETRFFPVIK